ncbi:MAG: glycine zipper domain-containing protein [Kiloniellales bacterium]|nr:glycine zipper domain-containing protein [Kiloniellales bacterium]
MRAKALALVLSMAMLLAGCAQMRLDESKKYPITGAAAAATAGVAIGTGLGDPIAGALVGGVIGAVAGLIYAEYWKDEVEGPSPATVDGNQ